MTQLNADGVKAARKGDPIDEALAYGRAALEADLGIAYVTFSTEDGWGRTNDKAEQLARVKAAIESHRLASSGGEAVAWEGYWPGAGSINSTAMLTKFKSTADKWALDGAEVTPLYPAVPVEREEVRVKALVWEHGEARSPLGDLYSVHKLSPNVWSTRWNGTAFTGWKPTEAEAMEVAQAHLNTRILEAIDG